MYMKIRDRTWKEKNKIIQFKLMTTSRLFLDLQCCGRSRVSYMITKVELCTIPEVLIDVVIVPPA